MKPLTPTDWRTAERAYRRLRTLLLLMYGDDNGVLDAMAAKSLHDKRLDALFARLVVAVDYINGERKRIRYEEENP